MPELGCQDHRDLAAGRAALGLETAIWTTGEWTTAQSDAQLPLPFEDPPGTTTPGCAHRRAYEDLLATARRYFAATGRNLNVFGEIGELYGVIHFGLRLNRPHAKGSDGRLGDAHVEVKTISPFKEKARVRVRLADRNFSKLLVVRVTEDFTVAGRMIDRKALPRAKGTWIEIGWDDLPAE